MTLSTLTRLGGAAAILASAAAAPWPSPLEPSDQRKARARSRYEKDRAARKQRVFAKKYAEAKRQRNARKRTRKSAK